MLQFLQPIWLLGITGITLPVLIHLWNQRQGNVLQVGSVALLQDTPRKSARSMQLSEWWLLLLRCLLIILLSLILAGPQWKARPQQAAKQGWVLVAREAGPAVTKPVDSLLEAGFKLHWFEPGFSAAEAAALKTAQAAPQNYWATLALLQQQIAPGQPVVLFTDRKAAHFSGERPRLQMNLQWRTVEVNATPAVQAPPDSTRQFTVWAGAHAADAQYVQAALIAIRNFSGRHMDINMVSDVASLPAAQDWLFWLSETPPPAAVHATHLFRYMPGTAAVTDSWLAGAPDIAVSRYTTSGAEDALWSDGYGHALLVKEGTNYNAYTHFNGAWNGLPWSARMPSMLLQLIYPGAYPDGQLLRPEDVQPRFVNGAGPAPLRPVQSLAEAGWLMLLALFLAERVLSLVNSRRIV